MIERTELKPSRVFVETDEGGSRLVLVFSPDQLAYALGSQMCDPFPQDMVSLLESAILEKSQVVLVTEERLAILEGQ